MRDQEAYEKLYKRCQNPQGGLDFEAYKKLYASEICKYSLFPVLGKIYSPNDKIFWSEELVKLDEDTTNKEKTYTWIHPLSNTRFKISRAGYLIEEEDLSEPPLTPEEAIRTLITAKLDSNSKYRSLDTFFEDYRKTTNGGNVYPSFDDFSLALYMVLKASPLVPNSTKHTLDTVRYSYEDRYDWTEEPQTSFLMTLLNALEKYQEELLDLNNKTVHVADPEQEFTSYEELDEIHDNQEEAYFQTQQFKDQILFGDYKSFEDLYEVYSTSVDEAYIRSFLTGVARTLCDVGLLTQSEVLDMKVKSVKTCQHILNRAYGELHEETLIAKVVSMLELDSLEDDFAILYFDWCELNIKKSKSSKENRKMKLLELSMKYLLNKPNALNHHVLSEVHQIFEKDLDALKCL